MLKAYCNKCGQEINNNISTLTNAFLVTEFFTNKQYHLCQDCGQKAITPLTKAEMIDIFLKDLGKNRNN